MPLKALTEKQREPWITDRRPAVFLDRDGVINVDHGYIHRPEQVEWMPGAHSGIRRINELGYLAIVVTNQAGVAHGFYEQDAVHSLHTWMSAVLARQGAFIDAFYYCPYHPLARIAKYRANHDDRKPGPGMILRALSDFHVDKAQSFLIGDKCSDMEAARRAGIPGFLFPGGDFAGFLEQCLAQMNCDPPIVSY